MNFQISKVIKTKSKISFVPVGNRKETMLDKVWRVLPSDESRAKTRQQIADYADVTKEQFSVSVSLIKSRYMANVVKKKIDGTWVYWMENAHG